ncbi:flavin reductase family protein [Thiorhodococcus mannitoliphagus]|uniref:Flavin reductase family protein n=1 Tax=Thiorhodococcus mannitoliphagus TaxID=329406 RepID=A0A6P1DN05_9GAMM|nr:flavin reductase family protein [Thiorhodococcus mannitoliphagus]NEX19418.1 flavin reductase family protein [Thiorhodococcus mannitoliphagus]
MQEHRSLSSEAMDAIESAFHLYDPPLWLVTARAGERRGGLIATSAVRASIVPELPRMLIAIAKQHHTWGLIESSGRFALHLLPVDDLEVVWHFGLTTGQDTDKLAGLEMGETPEGNPRYPRAAAWMDCRVETSMDIGDRTVYLAQVVGGRASVEGTVLTVASLRRDAPPERKAELDRLYARDQGIDAAAIQAWRRDLPSP